MAPLWAGLVLTTAYCCFGSLDEPLTTLAGLFGYLAGMMHIYK